MPVGTSDGDHFDTKFDHSVATSRGQSSYQYYLDKYLENSPSSSNIEDRRSEPQVFLNTSKGTVVSEQPLQSIEDRMANARRKLGMEATAKFGDLPEEQETMKEFLNDSPESTNIDDRREDTRYSTNVVGQAINAHFLRTNDSASKAFKSLDSFFKGTKENNFQPSEKDK